MILGIDARLANEARRAGVGNYCAGLLRALPEVAPEIVFRCYLDALPRADFPLGGDQAEIRVLPRTQGWTQRALVRELRRDPPDVFFSPLTQLPIRCPCPAIATLHDLAFYRFPRQFTWRRLIRARLQAWHVARAAAHLLCDSEATAGEAQRHLAVPRGRLSVAGAGPGPGFDPPPDAQAVARVREKLGLPARYLLHVGRIQPRKNLVRLIDAFSRARAAHPDMGDVALLIAGDAGWLDADVRRAVERSPERTAIQMLGYVEEPDLPALVAGASALAMVGLWEGFGIPALEAMCCATPVLAADAGALPEVTGDAALLVDPYDTDAIARGIVRILGDESLRATLAERGPRQAARHTWENTARCLARAVGQVYENSR